MRVRGTTAQMWYVVLLWCLPSGSAAKCADDTISPNTWRTSVRQKDRTGTPPECGTCGQGGVLAAVHRERPVPLPVVQPLQVRRALRDSKRAPQHCKMVILDCRTLPEGGRSTHYACNYELLMLLCNLCTGSRTRRAGAAH